MKAAAAGVWVAGFPTIIPANVLGQNAPSKTVQVGQIGFGRIAKSWDVPGIIKCEGVRYVALSDLDAHRMTQGKKFIDGHYAKQGTSVGLALFQDYRELLARQDVDAVAISTPDHWHSQPAVEAAFAGKDVYLQKPHSLTIAEGRLVSRAITENKRVFLMGSQHRSAAHFRRACELVRNGRVGKVTAIEVGLPGDPGGGKKEEMPVPKNLNYDMWLGSTPQVYYTEDRVHPQANIDARPGWLRCEQFGAGMITGWGAHFIDIVHWGMGWEATGPVAISGKGVFHTGGLWDVHGDYDVTLTYAGGTPVRVWNQYALGIRFIGEQGWIFAGSAPSKITASDPLQPNRALKMLDASNPALLEGDIGENGIHLYDSKGSHHQNWINCIRSRAETVAPVETAHRSCSACLLAHIGMKLGRKLAWDPAAERFVNDDEANGMLARLERAPYGTRRAYERLTKKS
jgi:predicted dehydrogenase